MMTTMVITMAIAMVTTNTLFPALHLRLPSRPRHRLLPLPLLHPLASASMRATSSSSKPPAFIPTAIPPPSRSPTRRPVSPFRRPTLSTSTATAMATITTHRPSPPSRLCLRNSTTSTARRTSRWRHPSCPPSAHSSARVTPRTAPLIVPGAWITSASTDRPHFIQTAEALFVAVANRFLTFPFPTLATLFRAISNNNNSNNNKETPDRTASLPLSPSRSPPLGPSTAAQDRRIRRSCSRAPISRGSTRCSSTWQAGKKRPRHSSPSTSAPISHSPSFTQHPPFRLLSLLTNNNFLSIPNSFNPIPGSLHPLPTNPFPITPLPPPSLTSDRLLPPLDRPVVFCLLCLLINAHNTIQRPQHATQQTEEDDERAQRQRRKQRAPRETARARQSGTGEKDPDDDFEGRKPRTGHQAGRGLSQKSSSFLNLSSPLLLLFSSSLSFELVETTSSTTNTPSANARSACRSAC